MTVSNADVRAAYVKARQDVLDALNAHPNLHDAEFIYERDALVVTVETPLGIAQLYMPGLVYGGLMSDRQRTHAEEHAKLLADRIRCEVLIPHTESAKETR